MKRLSLSSAVIAPLVALLMLAVFAPAAQADTYNPAPGVRVNSPLGDRESRTRIHTHILRTIYSVPARKRIRIASWNVNSKAMVDGLIAAHRRGVSVQVVMDRLNIDPEEGDYNTEWVRLRNALARGNAGRPGYLISFARTCASSCRGGSGIPHIKFFLFEQSHRTPWVTMWGSHNLTAAAFNVQWNDLQTVVRNKAMWNFGYTMFSQMARDRAVPNPFQVRDYGPIRLGFFPYGGDHASGDPFVSPLNHVRCWGPRGRTVIRVSQTVISDNKGRAFASKLKQLWDAGCDVKVLSALYGDYPKAILSGRGGRGPVPHKEMVGHADDDGIYDRYLHHKVMTVNGSWRGNGNAYVVWNGSCNIADWTMASDEVYARNFSESSVRFYNRFVNYWFSRSTATYRSADGRTRPVPSEQSLRTRGIDPYSKIKAELGITG